MNPAFYKIRQYIRGTIIAKLWYDRNLIAHKKPGSNLDVEQMRDLINEGVS